MVIGVNFINQWSGMSLEALLGILSGGRVLVLVLLWLLLSGGSMVWQGLVG